MRACARVCVRVSVFHFSFTAVISLSSHAGNPKGVMISHGNVVAELSGVMAGVVCVCVCVCVSSLSLSHTHTHTHTHTSSSSFFLSLSLSLTFSLFLSPSLKGLHFDPSDVYISYLPLAHMMERCVQVSSDLVGNVKPNKQTHVPTNKNTQNTGHVLLGRSEGWFLQGRREGAPL